MGPFFSDTAATKALYEKYKPTHVIHLAALGAFLSHPYTNLCCTDLWCFPFSLHSRRLIHAFEVQSINAARQHPYQ